MFYVLSLWYMLPCIIRRNYHFCGTRATVQLLHTFLQLYCGLGLRDKLVEVQERESCNYTLSIETPLLCDHPMFDPLYVNDPQMLTCSPLISQKEYEVYMMQQGL